MDRIAIIGLGLIGSSLGMAMKKAALRLEIVGHDRDRSASGRASKLGAVDKTEGNLLQAVRGARLVIIATPVKAIEEIMKLIGPHLEEDCIVTDTGSTKGVVLQWAEEHLPRTVSFVGGHPMAGKEVSGPDGSQASLFEGASYCIIPGRHADQQAVKAMVGLAEAIGAKPYFIDPVEHDSYVGAVSHLPMLLSTALVRVTSKSPSWSELSKLAATGYRDITRLASGDPVMNRDICLTNQEGIVYWIDEFIRELYELRGLVKEGAMSLEEVFIQASEERARWLAKEVVSGDSGPLVDIPSATDNIGGLFVGERLMKHSRDLMDRFKEDKAPKQKR